MTKNPIMSLSKLLLTLNPFEFATLAFILGTIVSEGLNSKELNSLGNFYNLLGETMQTIGTQAQTIESRNQYQANVAFSIDTLKNKIENLEEIINKFKNI